MSFSEHTSRLLTAQIQHGENYDLISGGTAGDIRIWDIRQRRSIRVIDAVPTGVEMTAMAVHEQAPIFAWWVEKKTPLLLDKLMLKFSRYFIK
jgi:regulator-associated protein of mTOR